MGFWTRNPRDFPLLERHYELILDRLRAVPSVRSALLHVEHTRRVQVRFGDEKCGRLRGYAWPRLAVTCHPRRPAVLGHELVHVAHGTELDAEIVENYVFDPSEGATPPTAGDYEKFADEGSNFFAFDDDGNIYEHSGRSLRVTLHDLFGDLVEFWKNGEWHRLNGARVHHVDRNLYALTFEGRRGRYDGLHLRINGRQARSVCTHSLPPPGWQGRVTLKFLL